MAFGKPSGSLESTKSDAHVNYRITAQKMNSKLMPSKMQEVHECVYLLILKFTISHNHKTSAKVWEVEMQKQILGINVDIVLASMHKTKTLWLLQACTHSASGFTQKHKTTCFHDELMSKSCMCPNYQLHFLTVCTAAALGLLHLQVWDASS